MLGLTKPYHHSRLSCELREDLKTWLLFLKRNNGVVHIPEQFWFDSQTEKLFTDSAGKAEFGAACFFNGNWSFFSMA